MSGRGWPVGMEDRLGTMCLQESSIHNVLLVTSWEDVLIRREALGCKSNTHKKVNW